MESEDLRLWLRLVETPGIGPIHARKLLSALGLPQGIFGQDEPVLAKHVGSSAARALAFEPANVSALHDATLEWLNGSPQGTERQVLTLADERYPKSLLETDDPPTLLYVHSATGYWRESCNMTTETPMALAVVGSRNASAQGIENAKTFSRAFCDRGLTVVSGLALGIDGAAHEGALQSTHMAATVAVVGTGLDRVYPKRHLALAHQIVERGAIVSELPIGTPPVAINFPKRNRIISGLSRGTLVVEAAMQSGSLITARMATEQGKDVFAIPGSIHSTHARGCHALIKQGAKLVESADDLMGELGWLGAMPAGDHQSPSGLDAPYGQLRPKLRSVLAALGHDPLSLDSLCARTGVAPGELQGYLMELELEQFVARLPGGLYQQVVSG